MEIFIEFWKPLIDVIILLAIIFFVVIIISVLYNK